MSPLARNVNDPVWRLLQHYMPWLVRGNGLFSTNYFSAARVPEQGWKLHVSATPWSAVPILERIIPILLTHGVSCKFVNSTDNLMLLNNGCLGAEQVGKFVTVYPSSDGHAVELAIALHDATEGLPGPRIPTDRALRPGSLVHYRYGVLAGYSTQATEPAELRDKAGRKLPDRREVAYVVPLAGIDDPFERRGAFIPPPPREAPLAGRYLIRGVLSSSAYGGVYQAFDLAATPPRQCVLKEFRRHCGGDQHGRLAPDWGRREASLLARHRGDETFPQFFDMFELDGNLYVSLEYVEGTSLATELAQRANAGLELSVTEIVSIGQEIANTLTYLHSLGVYYRDVNPSNVIYRPPAACRLVDFGIAYEAGTDDGPPNGLGTADFCSHEQWAGQPPSQDDDVYSWGSLMHFLLSGPESINEIRAKDRSSSRRPIVRPPLAALRIDGGLANIVDRAVAHERNERYSSMREIVDDLNRISDRISHLVSVQSPAPEVINTRIAEDTALRLACKIGDVLCQSGIQQQGGLCWASYESDVGRRFTSPDIYHGGAGIGLYLCELGRRTQDSRYLEAAIGAARWLSGPSWATGRAQPGLYCGESGVGWFFIRLAEATKDSAWLHAAELRARRIRGVAESSLDLVTGSAGLVIFLARLAGATHKQYYLDQALIASASLTAARSQMATSPQYWTQMNRDEFGCQRRPYVGLAHGIAGVGLALTELAAIADDPTIKSAAVAAAEAIMSDAVDGVQDGWRWRECFRWPRHACASPMPRGHWRWAISVEAQSYCAGRSVGSRSAASRSHNLSGEHQTGGSRNLSWTRGRRRIFA